jgi:hypothetical protein
VDLAWYTTPGRTYRVQYTRALSDSNWMDLAGDVDATGNTGAKSESAASSANQRFYRVVLLP